MNERALFSNETGGLPPVSLKQTAQGICRMHQAAKGATAGLVQRGHDDTAWSIVAGISTILRVQGMVGPPPYGQNAFATSLESCK